ncbi:ExbD/TolR family protein [Bernardetia sp. OM2101]|uniref:ExbD/TolR family protein n=1 Tax=Bernardetia sp. OM2101 TaxID=3344876 RepID=UPI0035CF8111
MKPVSYIFIILFLQLCSSCLAQDKINYKNERLIIDCITEKYDSIDIDLQSEAKKYEQILIESKHLQDSSAKSYLVLYKDLMSTQINDSIPYNTALDKRLMGFRKKCVEKNITGLDSIVNDRFYEAGLLMDSVIKNQETMTTDEIIDANKRVGRLFSEKDFEEPYYRISILNMVSSFSIMKQEKFLIKIYIDLDHNIVLNGKTTTLDSLRKEVKILTDKIPDKEKKYIIVQISGDTSLDMGIVIDVREELRGSDALRVNYGID